MGAGKRRARDIAYSLATAYWEIGTGRRAHAAVINAMAKQETASFSESSPNRLLDGSHMIPPKPNSTVDRELANPTSSRPFRDCEALISNLNDYVVAAIGILPFTIHPRAISGFVSLRVFKPVYCVARCRFVPHIGQKAFKPRHGADARYPSFTNRNSSTSIIIERPIFCVHATINHRRPCFEKRMFRCCAVGSSTASSARSARCLFPKYKIRSLNGFFSSAFATTLEIYRHPTLKCSLAGDRDNGQPTKRKAGNVIDRLLAGQVRYITHNICL
jgi:hypothetical protein